MENSLRMKCLNVQLINSKKELMINVTTNKFESNFTLKTHNALEFFFISGKLFLFQCNFILTFITKLLMGQLSEPSV
jgi:hypothetical protein